LLLDSSEIQSLSWENRELLDSSDIISLSWGNRQLLRDDTSPSIDWQASQILNTQGTRALDYSNAVTRTGQLYDATYKDYTTQENASSNIGAGYETENYSGDIIGGTVDTGTLPKDGELCFLNTDGIWYLTDNSDIRCVDRLLGIPFNINPSTGACNVLLDGHVAVVDSASGTGKAYVENAEIGRSVYIKEGISSGEMSTTVPSTSGYYIRKLGHIYYKSTGTITNWMMKFKPSNDGYRI
jgi:hypothetical protein